MSILEWKEDTNEKLKGSGLKIVKSWLYYLLFTYFWVTLLLGLFILLILGFWLKDFVVAGLNFLLNNQDKIVNYLNAGGL